MERLSRRTRVQTVTNRNTPRIIRTRLSFPRRKVQGDLPAPEQPAQQVAFSNGGKMALGPWLGSFGGMDHLDSEPTSPTLFATSQGKVFADLTGSPVHSQDLLAASEEVVAAAAAPPAQPLDSREGRVALAHEMGVLRRKAEPRVPLGMPTRAPRANVTRRRYREIGQARKMN